MEFFVSLGEAVAALDHGVARCTQLAAQLAPAGPRTM